MVLVQIQGFQNRSFSVSLELHMAVSVEKWYEREKMSKFLLAVTQFVGAVCQVTTERQGQGQRRRVSIASQFPLLLMTSPCLTALTTLLNHPTFHLQTCVVFTKTNHTSNARLVHLVKVECYSEISQSNVYSALYITQPCSEQEKKKQNHTTKVTLQKMVWSL